MQVQRINLEFLPWKLVFNFFLNKKLIKNITCQISMQFYDVTAD